MTSTSAPSSSLTATPTEFEPYGSLVTPFTAPDFCSDAVRACDTEGSCAWMERGRTCGSDGTPTIANDCWPPGTTPLDAYLSTYSNILYFPATSCPEGWATVGRRVTSAGDATSRLSCCPLSFRSAAFGNSLSCSSDIKMSLSTVDQVLCIPGGAPITTTKSRTFTGQQLGAVWAMPIFVDFPVPRTDNSSTLSTMTASVMDFTSRPADVSASATPNADSSTAESNGSALSTGAIVGIVLGCITVLLLLLYAARVLLLYLRKQREHVHSGAVGRADFHSSSLPELISIKRNGQSGAEMSMGHPNDDLFDSREMGGSSTPTPR